MTCSQAEAKKWIKQNWLDLCENGNLSYAITRYVRVYYRSTKRSLGNVETAVVREETPADDYVKIKKELEKLTP